MVLQQGGSGWLLLSVNLFKLSKSAYLQIVPTKTLSVTIEEKQAICGCQGTYTYTDTSIFNAAINFFVSTKAGSPKAL